MDKPGAIVSRREFAVRVLFLGSLAASYPAAALAELRRVATESSPPLWLDSDPWATIAAVQDHLFPATADAPGAADFAAATYLHEALENADRDGKDKAGIFKGVGWLNELTVERFQRPFAQLNAPDRELALRQIEQSRAGRHWLSKLMTYLLEALLSDPIYGGNRQRIGWQWLEHQPGYPTPPLDKTWDRLRRPANSRIKA